MKIIAFIPVRGGSKSIPLKNIKNFCGKPLVYWCVNALQQTEKVDEIVVATDSGEIERVVRDFHFDKVNIYRRSPENARDTSTTESVMLEYITSRNPAPEDIFMLVQATSPLTQSRHFDEALQIYLQSNYDSMLTCVRHFRFFWSAEGHSLNYDYRHRPRRQDFAGNLMENGAFYINKVAHILASGNRLSGKIGIYEMPEYTATEIDEPEDWVILEQLMYKYVLPHPSFGKVRLFLTDVDGVLTDAGMYYSENGDELKKFNTRDGMGLKLIQQAGIKTGIITSEDTRMVERRARKLGIDYLYQGKREGGKLAAALEICRMEGVSLQQVAYIGDDVNCKDLLAAVGIAFCPADAVDEIKRVPGIHQLACKGGEGVVREAVERILPSLKTNLPL